MKVSSLSIAFILFDLLLGIALPAAAMIFLRKKKGTRVAPFFIGCASMLLFALILEPMLHRFVLSSAAGAVIRQTPVLYALYGGLAAGLFEETGRFLAMRFALRKSHDDPHASLMYGLGHGGFEMFVILSVGMVNNLLYAVFLNGGMAQKLLEPLDPVNQATLQSAFAALAQTPPSMFLVSPLERLAALTAQVSLSVVVWIAATRPGKAGFYLLAVALHLALDAVSALLAGLGLPVLAVEAVVWAMALLFAALAVRLWRKHLKAA